MGVPVEQGTEPVNKILRYIIISPFLVFLLFVSAFMFLVAWIGIPVWMIMSVVDRIPITDAFKCYWTLVTFPFEEFKESLR